MVKATRHTAIIGDPVGMWSKLAWDADVFRDIQTSYPDEAQPLAYAAINVCIAAASLQDWVEAFLKPSDKDAFYQEIIGVIPEQSACIAIANTSKHAEFRERRWVNGEVQLIWEEGDEDIPSGHVLYHVVSGSHSEGFAVSRFDSLCLNWWTYLTERGLADGHSGIPEWRANKLNRMLGLR